MINRCIFTYTGLTCNPGADRLCVGEFVITAHLLSVTLHSTRLISWVRCVLVSSVPKHGFVEVTNNAEIIFGPQDRSPTIYLLFSALLSTQILSTRHRMPTLRVPGHETVECVVGRRWLRESPRYSVPLSQKPIIWKSFHEAPIVRFEIRCQMPM